ncbi:MAG: L,D-transpeptidase family protein [Candidatus Omnitrophota bacterium]
MNKRLLITIASILVFIIFLLLAISKIKLNTHINAGQVVSSSTLSAQAAESLLKGGLLEAKSLYQRLIHEFPNSPEVMNWEKKSEEINLKLLFSPMLTPGGMLYEIKSGDTLNRIAGEFNTTVELIMKSNNLKDDKIIPGRKIKVWIAPFSIVVDKSQNTLILKTGEEIIKTYIVSTGVNNSTPVGNFKIINKLIDPTWFKAGLVVAPDSLENVLGSRWLGFDLTGYGIHGTIDPQNLGKQVTQGCIRMSNPEVKELYMIVPIGTEVTIID